MKRAIIFAAAAILTAGVGCQEQQTQPPKAAADPAALELTPTNPAPAPVAYASPVNDPALTTTATPVATPLATASPSSNSYKIKRGDTLWKIAASRYGDGKKWQQICDANPGLTPSQLRVGQMITLP